MVCMKKLLLILLCATMISTSMGNIKVHAQDTESIKRIALTFDDGPHPKQTKQILDVLDKYNVKATFFVIGINVKNYPGIISEVINRGHEIGNHTYTHPHAAKLDREALRAQILDCEQEIFNQTGQSVHLFRPPEGAVSAPMRQMMHDLDYINVLWNLDTRDWAHTPPEEIARNILQNAKNGDIILMHDYIGYNSPTVQALELFLPQLIEQGFTFVTVGELLQNK